MVHNLRIRPFLLGVRDGWQQPFELSSGMTWDDDQGANEFYDCGVNVGQFIRSPRNHQRDAARP